MFLFFLAAIICISGDGVVHDVLNGMLKRKDWQEALKVPVGLICAGLFFSFLPFSSLYFA